VCGGSGSGWSNIFSFFHNLLHKQHLESLITDTRHISFFNKDKQIISMNPKVYTTILFNIMLLTLTCAHINPNADIDKTEPTSNPSKSAAATQQQTLSSSKELSVTTNNEHLIIKSDKNTSVLQNNELKFNKSTSSNTAIKPITTQVVNSNMNLTKMTSKIIDKLAFRLPKIIKPMTYELLMHPDLKKKTFSGSVKIKIDVQEPVDYIALHSKKLNISKVWLETAEELKTVKLSQSFAYEKFEYFILESEQTIQKGLYLINLEFDGSLDNRIVGFYGSTYLDPVKNETRYTILIEYCARA
jgi:RimJ/RimL family protein N-acetyltransferase